MAVVVVLLIVQGTRPLEIGGIVVFALFLADIAWLDLKIRRATRDEQR